MTDKIDVVMITKNSEKPCLKESLNSIVHNLPLKRLIVVDSFSSDGTLGVINELVADKKIVQAEAGRGKAREIGIGEVHTDLFAFVDSDVILSDGWYAKIIFHLEPRIGAVEGNVKTREGQVQNITKNRRAYTNCTLVRTEAVRGISIPDEVRVYEDQYIRRFIEKRHFEWLKVADPCSLHLSGSSRIADAYEIGRIGGKYRLETFASRVRHLISVLLRSILGGDVEDLAIQLRIVKGHLAGWIERHRSLV